MYLKAATFSLLLAFLCSCSDNATVTKYDKTSKKLECLRLVVFPPDRLISDELQKLYTFKNECPYELQASRKSGISCNSNQNAPKKALSNFPTGYLRLDIYKERKPLYSYYKDLNRALKKEDIESAFQRVQADMLQK